MSGKMAVVCYTEEGDSIAVVVDPDPVEGTFLVRNLRKAVKEERKPFYDSIPADRIPIAVRGSTERLTGEAPLDSKAYVLPSAGDCGFWPLFGMAGCDAKNPRFKPFFILCAVALWILWMYKVQGVLDNALWDAIKVSCAFLVGFIPAPWLLRAPENRVRVSVGVVCVLGVLTATFKK